jgi:small-conductance mechanosensitive channel
LLIPIVPGSKPINNSTIQQFNNLPTRSMSAARTYLLWCLAAALCLASPAGGQETPVAPTPAPTPTRAAPVPLAEIATRSDNLAVYLKQVGTRVAPDPAIASIAEQLSLMSDRVRVARIHSLSTIAASPPLREVDDLLDQWHGFQTALSDWSAQLTSRATALEQELKGLDELRAIWRATRDEAQSAGAPAAVLDRIKSNLNAIQQSRNDIDAARETLLILQDRVLQQANICRDAINDLTTYRSTAVGRLLVRDGQPIWSAEQWSKSREEGFSPLKSQFLEAARLLPEYLRLQLPRLPFQIAVFVLLLILWRRARQRTNRWLADDNSLAPIAAVFEHPISAALFLTLLATPVIYPQLPILLRTAIRIVAVVPLLRILDRLVDRPILPGLFVLGAFFMLDQMRTLLAPLTLVDQVLLLVEVVTGLLVLIWMLRTRRIQQLRSYLSPRVVNWLEGAARVVVVVLAFALLAGALGFMQLASLVAGTVLGSGYAAMLLYALQRLAQGMWAFALRTRTARRLRVVQHYRSLLEARAERVFSWIAVGLWLAALAASAGVFDATREMIRTALTTPFGVGSFHVSLGDLLAFAVTIWLSILLSRFTRFILEEDVYPRLRLARGLPYAFSTILHYVLLSVGLIVALAAAGLELDRFALLAGAFGVGVGFGLQNVVNNFVSGLILLFERPIQVGDTVELGALTGEVRRIGIRSSTVRTAEGAEVIVPNGQLIAEAVTNWTLSDRMRRIDLAMALPYGTDPEPVIKLLRDVAAAHPMVVEAPAPIALVVGFAANTINLELRAWTDRFEQWVGIRSDLAIAVTKALIEAHVVVAPPPPASVQTTTPHDTAPAPPQHGSADQTAPPLRDVGRK